MLFVKEFIFLELNKTIPQKLPVSPLKKTFEKKKKKCMRINLSFFFDTKSLKKREKEEKS